MKVPVEMPVCQRCRKRIEANLCQVSLVDQQAVDAITDLLLAVHRRFECTRSR